jgi:hypothetical protein
MRKQPRYRVAGQGRRSSESNINALEPFATGREYKELDHLLSVCVHFLSIPSHGEEQPRSEIAGRVESPSCQNVQGYMKRKDWKK